MAAAAGPFLPSSCRSAAAAAGGCGVKVGWPDKRYGGKERKGKPFDVSAADRPPSDWKGPRDWHNYIKKARKFGIFPVVHVFGLDQGERIQTFFLFFLVAAAAASVFIASSLWRHLWFISPCMHRRL